MDYTRTPGPQVSLNYHSALWEEGQQAGGVDSEGLRVKEQGGGRRHEEKKSKTCCWHGLSQAFNQDGSMQRQGQRKGL